MHWLIRMLLLDKRAFFLVSTSDVGAQIYELVANSKDEKNKFVHSQLFHFCHTFCSFRQESSLLWTHALKPFINSPIALAQGGEEFG